MYNLRSFDCSWHELHWLLVSCTRASLVSMQNGQESSLFSCKYTFDKGKVNAPSSPYFNTKH